MAEGPGRGLYPPSPSPPPAHLAPAPASEHGARAGAGSGLEASISAERDSAGGWQAMLGNCDESSAKQWNWVEKFVTFEYPLFNFFMSALKSDVKSVCYIPVISGNDVERYYWERCVRVLKILCSCCVFTHRKSFLKFLEDDIFCFLVILYTFILFCQKERQNTSITKG